MLKIFTNIFGVLLFVLGGITKTGGILMDALGFGSAWETHISPFITNAGLDNAAGAFLGFGSLILIFSWAYSYRNRKTDSKAVVYLDENTSHQIIQNKSAATKQEIEYAVTLEEKRCFISSETPEFSRALNFDFMGDPLGGIIICGQAESIERPDPAIEEFRDTPFIRSVCEIELTNHGKNTILNISFPVRVSFFEAIQEGKNGIRSGSLIKSIEKEMSLKKLKIESDKPINFLITNSSPYFLQMDFPGNLIGETHTVGRAVIPYIHSRGDAPPIGLSPITRR